MSDEGHSIKNAMKSKSGTVSVPKAIAHKVSTSRSIAAEQWTAKPRRTLSIKQSGCSKTDSRHLVMKELGVILNATICFIL